MNKSTYTLAFVLATSAIFSQTTPDAVKKSESELFDAADADFRSLISKQPTLGDNYFFLGDNFFRNGLLDKRAELIDSAEFYFKKGSELNATNGLNYVGLGKVLLFKNNINDAKAQFFKAASVSQNKNAEVARRTAEAWLQTESKSADDALNAANLAVKLDAKNPESHIVLGDALLEKTPADGGPAIKAYKAATALNPKNTKGILREGKLYQRGRNYQLALDKYNEALTIDNSFAPAHREIAELYFLAGKSGKSIESWKKYLELNNSNFARYRFISALYRNKQYTEAVTEYENLKKTNFNNLYLERLAGYSYYEMGDKTDKEAYNKGMKALNDFFKAAGPNFKYITEDYKYKGLLYVKTGKDSLGVVELENAIKQDPGAAKDLYSEIAGIYYKSKKYDNVISTVEKKTALDANTLNNNDFFNAGRAYYNKALPLFNEAVTTKDAKVKSAKETEALPLLIKADTAFNGLVRKNQTWPTAYTWKGRTNSLVEILLKKEKDGLAKPHYEKVVSMLKPEEKTGGYKRDYIEALEYLGAYYVTINDKAKADETWGLVKEADPNNAKQLLYFKPKPAGGATAPKKITN
jgi:predicted Zn-dependent protease